LPPGQRVWTIRFPSEPDTPLVRGTFEQIGLVIDPIQRTVAVTGGIENPETARGEGRFRVGQLLLFAVPLPAPAGAVAVARGALVEQGADRSVFVQADLAVPQYVRRTVALLHRGPTLAHLRADPTPDEALRGCKPLKPGERVVSAAAVELAGALQELATSR